MPFTNQQLADEINLDPVSLGYAPLKASGSDSAIAGLLNQVRSTITINRRSIEASEIMSVVEPGEYATAGPTNQKWFDLIVGVERVYLTATVRTFFSAVFGATSATRPRILALINRNGSRAEQLWGEGTAISHTDVAKALGRG